MAQNRNGPDSDGATRRRADWPALLSATLLAACTAAAYGRTFSVPLLFDDLPTVLNNASIRHWASAWRPPLESTASGRPVLNLSLAFNYAVSGATVWSYHALNLLIHILAALTLFGIVRRTLGWSASSSTRWTTLSAGKRVGDNALHPTLAACCVALLWSLHPLQTEAVTYIVQRAESLMGLFYLLTIYCFIRAVDAEGETEARRPPSRSGGRLASVGVAWSTLCLLACLCGMATKEVMASAPLVVLLYDRTFVAGSFRAAWQRRRSLYLGLAGTWIVLFLLVLSTHGRNRTAGFGSTAPWPSYALTQFPAIAHYLKLIFWPHPLVFDYGAALAHPSWRLLPSVLLVTALAALGVWALVRRPALGFLAAAFFLVLAPSSSVVPVATQTMAEHRMYLPLIPAIVLLVLGLFRWLGRAALPLCLVLAAGLFALTSRRNETYRSALSLWSDTVAKDPSNPRAHDALGNVWAEIPGRLDDAIAQYGEALRLDPAYAEARFNLGDAWVQRPDRLAEAIAQYEQALRFKPDYAEAHINLGSAWAQVPGRGNEAVAELQEGLRLKPEDARAHNNLGNLWSQMPGRADDAIAQYREALRLKPDYVSAHFNLAIALLDLPGHAEEAKAHLETVLRLHPGDEAARQVLATLPGAPP